MEEIANKHQDSLIGTKYRRHGAGEIVTVVRRKLQPTAGTMSTIKAVELNNGAIWGLDDFFLNHRVVEGE